MSAYILTQNQLRVLLSGIGCSRITGLELNNESLDNSAVLNVLNDLSKAGFIVSSEDSFIIKDKIKSMLSVIASAEKSIIIRTTSTELPDICCYGDRQMVVCNYSTTNNESIILDFADSEKLFKRISDEGYYPETKCEALVPEQKLLEFFEASKSINFDVSAPISKNSELLFSAAKVNDKGEVLASVNIIDYYFYPYLLCLRDGEVLREKFSSDSVKRFIEWMVNSN